jgi:DNA primase large subunit
LQSHYKISRLIDVYLEGTISLEEYQLKKEKLINDKKELQEKIRDFVDEGNNWFELYFKRAPFDFLDGRYLPSLPQRSPIS